MSITFNIHGRDIKIAETDLWRVTRIISRAVDETVTLFLRGTLFDLAGDLAFCRRRYRMDLEKLLAANKDEFLQEIIRINRAIDRETGEMTEGFTPRYFKKREAVKA